jgi:hypothetical protein
LETMPSRPMAHYSGIREACLDFRSCALNISVKGKRRRY